MRNMGTAENMHVHIYAHFIPPNNIQKGIIYLSKFQQSAHTTIAKKQGSYNNITPLNFEVLDLKARLMFVPYNCKLCC